MLLVVRSVFGPPYIAIAVAVTGMMLFGMLMLSGFVFLSPYITGHILPGTEVSFVLLVAIAIMSGIVIPMSIYHIVKMRNNRTRVGGSILGSIIGTATGACSCGPVGFAIISTFGGVGGAAASFLTNYEIPLRVAALAVLVLAAYTTGRSLNASCSIK